jgi:hypothetical protein
MNPFNACISGIIHWAIRPLRLRSVRESKKYVQQKLPEPDFNPTL